MRLGQAVALLVSAEGCQGLVLNRMEAMVGHGGAGSRRRL